jgi:hypothetical protein
MHNGPQPRTVEDRRWREQDKRQCMEDAFNSIVTQHELVRGAWDGFPLVPIWERGSPNRFGRLEENKRANTRPLYIKEPFHRTSVGVGWDPAVWLAPGQQQPQVVGGDGGGGDNDAGPPPVEAGAE